MTWLNWTPVSFGGWTGLTVPVLAWLLFSLVAIARFAPRVRTQWRVFFRERARQTNGGTVALAALEQAVNLSASMLVCLLCLSAAVLAGHRERTAVLPLLVIPVVKVFHAELGVRAHAALMRALEAKRRAAPGT